MIEAIMNEALATIAKHYAEKIATEGHIFTQAEIEAAVANNWDKIAADAVKLYHETVNQLKTEI